MPAFIIYLVLSCLTCLAMVSTPSLIFILAIIWGMLLILAGVETNKFQLIIILSLNLLLIWLRAGSSSVLVYSLYIGLPALAMGVKALNKNNGYYDLLKVGLLTAVVTMVILMGAVHFNSNWGINQIEPQIKSYIDDTLQMYDNSGIYHLYEEQGIDRGEVRASFYQLARLIINHLPALYFLQMIIIITLSLYFASCLACRRGIHQLNKLPYSREIMPWQLAWAAIAGLALWLVGKDASTIRLIGSNLLTVMAPVSAYFGLSVLAFKLSITVKTKKRWIITLAVIISIIFTMPIFIFISLLGLFDSLLDYRKLRDDKEVP